MGYYVFGSGEIYLSKNDTEGFESVAANLGLASSCISDVIDAILVDAENHGFQACILKNQLNHDWICYELIYEYQKYYTESMEFFENIKPLLRKADDDPDVYFEGDDGERWCISVTGDGKYEETQGKTVYDGISCDKQDCAYINNGYCRYHFVHDAYPKHITENCNGYIKIPQNES